MKFLNVTTMLSCDEYIFVEAHNSVENSGLDTSQNQEIKACKAKATVTSSNTF